ncbi:MAG: hypothetical protein ACPLN0_07555 [Candidatus Hydrothermia bacterium]
MWFQVPMERFKDWSKLFTPGIKIESNERYTPSTTFQKLYLQRFHYHQ